MSGRLARARDEVVGAPGSPGLRWVLAATAVLLAAVTGATATMATVGEWRRLAGGLSVLGVVCLVTAVVRRGGALPWAVAALGGGAGLTLAGREGEVAAVVVLAAALVAVAELAGWSVDLRGAVPETRVSATRHGVGLALVVATSAVLAGAVLAVGRLPAPGGALPFAVGVLAALGLVLLLTARRWDT